MKIFVDESGDFGFPDDRYDCYVLAAVVCPDDVYPRLEALVSRLTSAWGVDELHSAKLEDDQRLAAAIGLSRLDIRFVAIATDTELDSKSSIQNFRLAQADLFKKSWDTYVEGTLALGMTPDPKIGEFTDRAIKRAGLASQVSDSEIVQTHYTFELLHQSIQASLLGFMEDRWKTSFSDFSFELDAKLTAKLSSGEKVLDDHLLPTLGSRPHRPLGVLDTWKGPPPHPFITKYQMDDVRVGGVQADSGFDLRKIFEHGLRFVDSAASAGVQAADLISNSLRAAVIHHEARPSRLVAEALLPLSFREGGVGAQIARLGGNGNEEQDLSRFRPISLSR